jgi:hypothetical protein
VEECWCKSRRLVVGNGGVTAALKHRNIAYCGMCTPSSSSACHQKRYSRREPAPAQKTIHFSDLFASYLLSECWKTFRGQMKKVCQVRDIAASPASSSAYPSFYRLTGTLHHVPEQSSRSQRRLTDLQIAAATRGGEPDHGRVQYARIDCITRGKGATRAEERPGCG